MLTQRTKCIISHHSKTQLVERLHRMREIGVRSQAATGLHVRSSNSDSSTAKPSATGGSVTNVLCPSRFVALKNPHCSTAIIVEYRLKS